MKLKANKDTADSDHYPSEAYRKESKAPRRGVKADDEDEYDSHGSNYNKSVDTHKAYGAQDKAPPGRGRRGPSQNDGGPIQGWNTPVTKSHGAYAAQHKWGESNNNQTPSLGFKLESQTSGYLGHMAQDKYLRQGHNDGPNMNMDGVSDGLEMGSQGPKPAPSPAPSNQNALESAQDSMRQAFNYTSSGK